MRWAVVTLLLLMADAVPARASVVYDVPSGITSAPADDRGWSLTGSWQQGGGVAIAPNYFLTAQHLGGGLGIFTLNGTPYQSTAFFDIAGTDLRIVQINGTLPQYAPLYRGSAGSELNQPVSLVGFGRYAQGTPYVTNGIQNGWTWAVSTSKNFAMNTFSATSTQNNMPMLEYTFDPLSSQNEGIYTVGDSGGGAFVPPTGTGPWRLAGIAYAIDNFFSFDPSTNMYTPLIAPDGSSGVAVYDSTGLFTQDDQGKYVRASGPQHGYASEVAASLMRIDSIILPGDINNDGTINFSDLLALAQNYGSTGTAFLAGDVNGDGKVDFSDLLLLAQHYGQDLTSGISPVGSPAVLSSAVPEPSALSPLLVSLACLRLRRSARKL